MLVSQDITVKADTGGQTAVSEYALSWDGHTELGYQIGGPGGRTEGLMTLEECSEAGAKFDCSAFTSMVYRHFGIEIPAQSEAQKAAAKQIFYNEEDAVPGDIAWWYGHVAIYIGDGKVMHTNTHRPPTNYPHVSTFAGEGANYRTPDAYLRMVDDVSELGEAGSSTEEDVENAVGYGSMITESDLTGMPIKSTLIDEQQRIELKDRSSLSSYDIENLDYIKAYLEDGDASTTAWYTKFTSFLGIVLIFYALLLLVAYMLDYSNQFIDFSLLSFLSFGRFRVIDWDDYHSGLINTGWDAEKKITYLTKGMLFIRVVILVIIGCLLLSGVVGNSIANLISIITNRAF